MRRNIQLRDDILTAVLTVLMILCVWLAWEVWPGA